MTNVAVEIRVVTSLEELYCLENEHNALFASFPGAIFSNTFAYILASAKISHKDCGWRYFAAFRGSQLVGCLYGYRSTIRRLGVTLPVFEFCTELLSAVLYQMSRREEVLQELLLAAMTDQRDCVLFNFERVTKNTYHDLRRVIRNQPMAAISGWGGFGYRIDATLDKKVFLQQIRRKTRQEIARQERRFTELYGETFSVEQSGDVKLNLERLWEFVALEDSGWKGENGTSIAKTKGQRAYYEELVRSAATERMMTWYVLRDGEKPVAMALTLTTEETVWVPKVCFADQLSKLSPGTLCNHKLLLHCIADRRIKEVNFITGAPWLRQWKPVKVRYRSIRIFGRNRWAKLFHPGLMIYRALKHLLLGKTEAHKGRDQPVL